MRDYDVAAIGLASPPPAAFKTTYKPAITVKNNGTHPALVTGSIQILNRDTGLQVFSSPVTLAALAAGATGAALALADVTFAVEGNYLAYGFVTTEHDSYSPNNNLNPTSFKVGPGTPPTPVVVPAHAPQHENGATDELEVEGLSGKLATPQEPEDHVATHQLGGADQIVVSGLTGELATAQVPKAHSNAYHSPVMATAGELTAHQGATAAHSAATNLANRETTGPFTGLVKATQLGLGSMVKPVGDRYLRQDFYWHTPVPDNLICLWDGTNPVPDGWAAIIVNPTPNAPHIYIQRLPTP
jgi:hypothetical protein